MANVFICGVPTRLQINETPELDHKQETRQDLSHFEMNFAPYQMESCIEWDLEYRIPKSPHSSF